MTSNQKDLLMILLFILIGLGFWAWIAWVLYFSIPEAKERQVRESSFNSLFLKAPQSHFIKTETIKAVITTYNAVEAQTDQDPTIMASNKEIFIGAIACPQRLPFGTAVVMDGKTYWCFDRMARKYRNGNYFDILVESKEEALNFGRQTKELIIYF